LDFIKLVSSKTIEVLWRKFDDLSLRVPQNQQNEDDDDSDNEDYEDELGEYLSHLRQFTSNITRVVAMNQLDMPLLSKLDILALYEKFHLAVERDPIKSIQTFSQFRNAHPTLLEEYQGLQDITRFIDEIWNGIEGKDELTLKIWLEDLLFFLYYPAKNKLEGKERKEMLSSLEKEVYAQQPSQKLRQELTALVTFLGGKDGLSGKLSEKVKGRLLFSLYSVIKWQRQIMDLMEKAIIESLNPEGEYTYCPPWSTRRAQIGRPIHFFEDLNYFIEMRRMFEELKSLHPPTLGDIYREYQAIRVEGELDDKVRKVGISTRKVCLVQNFLRKTAQEIGQGADSAEALKQWEPEKKNMLKDVLNEKDLDENLKEERQIFFLQLIPEGKLNKLLQNKQVLESIGMQQWLVEGGIKEAPYHLLPFMFDGSPQANEYNEIEQLVLGGKFCILFFF